MWHLPYSPLGDSLLESVLDFADHDSFCCQSLVATSFIAGGSISLNPPQSSVFLKTFVIPWEIGSFLILFLLKLGAIKFLFPRRIHSNIDPKDSSNSSNSSDPNTKPPQLSLITILISPELVSVATKCLPQAVRDLLALLGGIRIMLMFMTEQHGEWRESQQLIKIVKEWSIGGPSVSSLNDEMQRQRRCIQRKLKDE